jgi:DNA-binding SARP family transcriptional activator
MPFRSEKGLDMYFLGTVGVSRGDKRLCSALPPKALALLILLVIEAPRRYSREQLASFFWPQLDSDNARNNLRRLLHTLRTVLGKGTTERYVLTDRSTVQFNTEAPFWCDLRQMMNARVPRCTVCNPDISVGCIDDQDETFSLYKGELFGGPFHWVSEEFEAWETVLRESVLRRAKILCAQLLKCSMALRDHARMVRYAETYVDLVPDEEFAYTQLAEIYTALNWTGAAADAYERYRKRMLSLGYGEDGVSYGGIGRSFIPPVSRGGGR